MIASTSSISGQTTAISPGVAEIQASWTGQLWFEDGGERCDFFPIEMDEDGFMEVTPPTVASISASMPSTRNPNITQTPPAGSFTTTNTSLTFATETTTDLMVVFQGSETITINAQGINPPNAGSQLRWQINRDPNNTLSGTPTISATTGSQITLTPTTAGNFRLICYFDTNNNGSFDNGEELRVLLFAVIRVIISSNNCNVARDNLSFSGSFPGSGEFGVTYSGNSMLILCEFTAEGGGANRRIGLNKVNFGNIGNLTADNAKVLYNPNGLAIEIPGGALPMVDTSNVEIGQQPTGGNTAFRGSSIAPSENNSSGGKNYTLTSSDAPKFGPFPIIQPNNGNTWDTTDGGYDFREYIVGFTDTFTRTYVVLARANWTIRFLGTRSTSGGWTNGGSHVTLQGQNQQTSSATFTLNVTNGSPQPGNSAGIQVLGLSYVNEKRNGFIP